MEAKYKLTLEENIFVAKRNIVDYMWKSARLEGIGVTYPDTEAIFNGLTVQGISVRDTIAVNNLKHAWQFVLENISYPMDYAFICKINQLVGSNSLVPEAGFVRFADVTIGGTSWKPEIPDVDIVKAELAQLQTIPSGTDRAITTMLYCMRRQLFFDGNKRTSMLAANQIMISSGEGIISVPIELQPEFTRLLVDFYETNDMTTIKGFVYDKCIDGIHFEKKREQPPRHSIRDKLAAAKAECAQRAAEEPQRARKRDHEPER